MLASISLFFAGLALGIGGANLVWTVYLRSESLQKHQHSRDSGDSTDK